MCLNSLISAQPWQDKGSTQDLRRCPLTSYEHYANGRHSFYPRVKHSCILPDFTLIWMLTLWDYYWQTGSTEPLLTHHTTVQNALNYFRAHTGPRTRPGASFV